MAAVDMDQWRRQNSDPLTVDIVLTDGMSVVGNILIQKGKSLRDLLNAPEPFLEVESRDHGWMSYAKSAIRSVRVDKLPTVEELEQRRKRFDSSDANAVLGVDANATAEDLRTAFVKLQMLYHPDLYGGDHPPEIVAYVNDVARRINSAYASASRRLNSAKPPPAPGAKNPA